MISIVMTYFNRRKLLISTLLSIQQSRCRDKEIIVVDDASDESHRIDDLVKRFNFRLIRIEPYNKKKNCCSAFNLGFRNATGDVILIQNAECMHVGDLLSYIQNNITEQNYLTASCYSLGKRETGLIGQISYRDLMLDKESVATYDKPGWYNHPEYRPVGYHFAAAITRRNLHRLNGFDEKFADELCFDDDEFLCRVKKMGLNVSIIPLPSPFVLHQYHAKVFPIGYDVSKNEQLYQQTLASPSYRAEKGIE